VGEAGVITDPARLLAYESDALTTLRGAPAAAVFPTSAEDLAAVVRVLHGAGVPFVPRGAGTGLAGGAVARGEVLVCTARMTRILGIDPVERTATVEPGVITAEISRAAASHELRYLPDPASATACTIGGNVAMNSGGPHCLRHGVTTDHIMALELVLPDGTVLAVGRGEDGGLDLAGLVIGSEGTLGIVSRITVKLAPLPAAVRAALALFDDLAAAGEAVSEILTSGVLPVALELIDAATIAVVEASAFAAGLPTDVAAALVVECEGEPDDIEAELTRVARIVERHGARGVRIADSEEERARIWQARKRAYGALGRLAPDILVQDAVVPRTALPSLLRAIERAARSRDLRLANFFHAGDGNLHPNLVFDGRNAEEVGRVEEASDEIMRLCVEAGGTISGEHGIGLDKRKYMPLLFTEAEMRAQGAVKRVFDANGSCNPHKMLPLSREAAP